MDDIFDLRNRRITVMGLGLHGGGLAVTKWLLARGARVLVTDLRDKGVLASVVARLKNRKRLTFVLGRHREQDFEQADLIIKNPGVPRDSKYLAIARKNGIPIETDMSLFFRMCVAPIIGITGTKGKSTTTTLIYEMFKRAKRNPVIGGNIRISPLSFLSKIKQETPVVLELSSWQLEDMEHLHVSPHIAVLTNVLPDHLNRYKNMAEYARSKQLAVTFQNKNDIAVINHDNAITRAISGRVKSRRYFFSTSYFKNGDGCFVQEGNIVFRISGQEEIICSVEDIRLPGAHNVTNVLAAIIVAKESNISNQIIHLTLRTFKGVPDRLELIRTLRGRKFYNDTTATAPDAAVAALKCFRNQHILLLAGGYDKGLNYQQFAHEIKKSKATCFLFSGTATDKLLRELKKVHCRKYIVVESMKSAVQHAWRLAKKDSIVILSPGAASFGIFLNEFDRGDQFRKEVFKLH